MTGWGSTDPNCGRILSLLLRPVNTKGLFDLFFSPKHIMSIFFSNQHLSHLSNLSSPFALEVISLGVGLGLQ